MIRRRQRIVGTDAIRGAKFGLGQIYRCCNGELGLWPNGYRVPHATPSNKRSERWRWQKLFINAPFSLSIPAADAVW